MSLQAQLFPFNHLQHSCAFRMASQRNALSSACRVSAISWKHKAWKASTNMKVCKAPKTRLLRHQSSLKILEAYSKLTKARNEPAV